MPAFVVLWKNCIKKLLLLLGNLAREVSLMAQYTSKPEALQVSK